LSGDVDRTSDWTRFKFDIEGCLIRLANADLPILNLCKIRSFHRDGVIAGVKGANAIEAIVVGGSLSRNVGLGVGDFHESAWYGSSSLVTHGPGNRSAGHLCAGLSRQ
jgi:hypothetical protein